MNATNVTVARFHLANEAITALDELCQAGLNPWQLSVVARDMGAESHVTGYCFFEGKGRFLSGEASFWQRASQLLPGLGLFFVPQIGIIHAAGPVVGWIMAALKNEALFEGISSLGAALHFIGISRSSIHLYEAEIKAGMFLVIVHGSSAEVQRAKELLEHVNYPAHSERAVGRLR